MPGNVTAARISTIFDADTRPLNRGINEANDRFRNAVSRFNAQSQRLLNVTRTSLLAVGAAFVGATRDALRFGDEIQKGAQFANLTALQYQGLQNALEQNGIAADRANNFIRGISRTVSEAGRGVATYTNALEMLNLTTDDFSATNQIQNLETVFQALGRVENLTDRASIAQTILGGRLSQQTQAFINAGGAVEPYIQQLRRLGAFIDDDVANNTAVANDILGLFARTIRARVTRALFQNGTTIQEWETRIVRAANAVEFLIDGIVNLIEWVEQNQTTVRNLAIAWAAFTGARALIAVVSTISTLITGFISLSGGIAGVVATIGSFVSRFAIFFRIGLRFVPIVGQISLAITAVVLAFRAWRDGADVTRTRLENVGLRIRIAFNRVRLFILNLPQTFRRVWDNIVTAFRNTWNSVLMFWSNVWTSIQNRFIDFVNFLRPVWEPIVERIRNVWDTVVSFFSDRIDEVVDFWTGGLDNMIETIAGFPDRVRTNLNTLVMVVTEAIQPILDFLSRLLNDPIGVLTEVFQAIGSSFVGAARSLFRFIYGDAEDLARQLNRDTMALQQNQEDIRNATQGTSEQMMETAGNMEETAEDMMSAATDLGRDLNRCSQEVLKTTGDEVARVTDAACAQMDDMSMGMVEISDEAMNTARVIIDAVRNGGWDEVGRNIVDIFADSAAQQAEDALSNILNNFFNNLQGIFSGNGQGGGLFANLFQQGGQAGAAGQGAGGGGFGSIFGSVIGSFLGNSFHEGGVVPGGPRMEVPALLQGGEAVFTRDQQRALGQAIGMGGMSQNTTYNVTGDVDEATMRALDRNQRRNYLRNQQVGMELGRA